MCFSDRALSSACRYFAVYNSYTSRDICVPQVTQTVLFDNICVTVYGAEIVMVLLMPRASQSRMKTDVNCDVLSDEMACSCFRSHSLSPFPYWSWMPLVMSQYICNVYKINYTKSNVLYQGNVFCIYSSSSSPLPWDINYREEVYLKMVLWVEPGSSVANMDYKLNWIWGFSSCVIML